MCDVAISERPHERRYPCAPRQGRLLRNSRTAPFLADAIYAYKLCLWWRQCGSTVLVETPALSAVLGASKGLRNRIAPAG